MIFWNGTTTNHGVHGLVTLLLRPEWSASSHSPEMMQAAVRLLDSPDRTIRMLAAPTLAVLFTDHAGLRDELARRLTIEPDSGVRARLLQVMDRALAGHPDYIDNSLAGLLGNPLWPTLSPEAEPAEGTADNSTRDVNDFLIQLLIALAVVHDQPFASTLLQTWMDAPAEHPARANRTCVWLRRYLNPDHLTPSVEMTDRAFSLLARPIPRAIAMWTSAIESTGTPTPAPAQTDRLTGVIKVSDSIAEALRFASGAAAPGGAATCAPAQFATRAFPILEELALIGYPAVVQEVIQALDHIAEHDLRRAFLAIAKAATTGHGYEWESLGADLVTSVIDRYAADHRDLLLTESACLTALRNLLETFVRSGWDQAIDRVQSLSDLLY